MTPGARDIGAADGFEPLPLTDGHALSRTTLPGRLLPDAAGFEALWRTHPAEYSRLMLRGRVHALPRWQQIYERDYHFSGQTSRALPLPLRLRPLLDWARRAIEPTLDGAVVNWYDGRLRHYIGPHRDSRVGLRECAPIVTISFGEERALRLRRHDGGEGRWDFPLRSGDVHVLPWRTNLAFTHEVPSWKRHTERRISVTFRAFSSP